MTSTELAPENYADAALTAFDYGTLVAAVAEEMRGHASRIHGLQRASILDVGRELIAAKKLVERGRFRDWVESACQMQIRTAQRAMRAAELVEKNDKLSYLPPDGLLALASRSTPEPVVGAIMAEIASGKTPNAAGIKRRITAAAKPRMRARSKRAAEDASLLHTGGRKDYRNNGNSRTTNPTQSSKRLQRKSWSTC